MNGSTQAQQEFVHADHFVDGKPMGQPGALASDAKWLDVNWLLGRAGDSVLQVVLPFVPREQRLLAAYSFRLGWLVLEVLVLLHCDKVREHTMSLCAGCVEHVLMFMRFAILHVLPVCVSFLAATNDNCIGDWDEFSRIVLYVDSAVYAALLLPLMCDVRARGLLLKTHKLTALRLAKLVMTPLETLIVIYGTFGRGYDYQQQRRRKMHGQNDIDSDSVLDSDSAEDLADALEECVVGEESQANTRMLWALWSVSMMLGVIFALQWFRPFSDVMSGGPWRPIYEGSTEGPGRARVVATAIFGMYGLGSAVTALLYLCMPDVLAANGYGFAQIRRDSQGDFVGDDGTVLLTGNGFTQSSMAFADERPSLPATVGDSQERTSWPERSSWPFSSTFAMAPRQERSSWPMTVNPSRNSEGAAWVGPLLPPFPVSDDALEDFGGH